MKYLPFFLLLWLAACNNQQKEEQNTQLPEIVNDTIPEVREKVSEKAVATFEEKVKDPEGLNNWKFKVQAFETPATFTYLLNIQYMELRVTDTLTIPNFGIRPSVALHPGPSKLSCIVGFLDKDSLFKDYKQIEIVKGQLKIRQLKGYRRALYKKL
ncbi:hypothetical protein [Dyadobacter tibetensis]|uniref:hypothetical protein n=1 Tax=Dyadobacter tibetensis TaxID=1211851 RepID=UPI0004708DAC|nr:hypothetical protein [Dyadobacter tibetensis]